VPWRPYPMQRMPRARPTNQWEKACSEKYARSRHATIQRVPRAPLQTGVPRARGRVEKPAGLNDFAWATDKVNQGVTRFGVGIRPPSYR
jgi:hypothetical protein